MTFIEFILIMTLKTKSHRPAETTGALSLLLRWLFAGVPESETIYQLHCITVIKTCSYVKLSHLHPARTSLSYRWCSLVQAFLTYWVLLCCFTFFFFNNLTYWTWDVFKCYKLFNHTNYQHNLILLPWISLLSNHQLLLLKLLHSNFETIIYLNANMSKVETDFNINLLLGFVIVSLMWKKNNMTYWTVLETDSNLPLCFL